MINSNFNIANHQLQQTGNELLERLQRESASGEAFSQLLQEAVAEATDASTPVTPATTGRSQLKDAAIEMETWFINEMFKAMRRTVPEGEGMFETSNAEQIWRDMLDEQTAKTLAQSGGLGLAQTLYEQLQRVNVG